VSDNDTDNKQASEEVAGSEAPEATAADETPTEPPPVTSASTTAASEKAATPSRRGGFIAWLALLLVIGLAAGSAWVVKEAQRRADTLAERVNALESAAGREDAELEQSLSAVEQQLDNRLDSAMRGVTSESAAQAARLQQLESGLAEQRNELARFSATDRESWLLAEAEYLLRLANQRLIMTGDTEAAAALLASADAVLKQLDDTALHPVRKAVAADLAVIRAVPQLDVEGLYLRLAALIEQADALVIFEFPELEAQPSPEPAEDWQGRLQQGYEAALRKLSDYIIIRRRDVPMQALMDPQWEGLVRQNLRMLLEQAQVALLSGNQFLFRESLGRAEGWVAEFFESDEAAARALAREIRLLQDETVQVSLPDTSRSLRALQDAVVQRGRESGES
jgi:uroporphyrin-3 C-methyltransferase